METPVNKDEILQLFKNGSGILGETIIGINDDELDYVPLKGGWTIRQIIHHIADGDDIWKIGIKMALGNEQAEFSLQWYSVFPQTEWAKKWSYEKRSIETSLSLLKVSRAHLVQLLESVDDGWSKSLHFRKPDGEIESVPVGFVIQMQANHVVHHVKRISEIHQEYLNK